MSAPAVWRGADGLLALWHPSGRPARRLGLGGVAPASDAADAAGPVDVAVVAPDSAQASGRWLREAVELAATRLAGDGVLSVIVPPRRRADARRFVTRAGLAPLGAVLTLPAWPRAVRLVSLDPAPLRDAAARQLGWSAAAARCAGAVARPVAGRALLSRMLPGCALLAAPHPAVDPLGWLAELDGGRPCTATASIGPRDGAGVAVVMRFPRGSHAPDLAVKVALDEGGRARVERERAALATLAGPARAAGAAIPEPRTSATPGLLAAGVLAGRRASHVLARDPGRIEPITAALAAWLRRWNAATAAPRPASRKLLDELLLAPAAQLAAAGVATAEYLHTLTALAGRLEGRELVLVAAHNDLTMANVLLDGERIGVVDWEAATPATAPLVDLWYALADGAARARRQSHAQAVASLLGARGSLECAPARLVAAAARALALGADEELLGFHACWLHHAANELERGSGDGPFTAVVRVLATGGVRWRPTTDAALR